MNRMITHAASLFLVAGLLCSAGCDSAPAPAAANTAQFQGNFPMKITCTVGMLGDLVVEIVGDRGEVKTLMGPGTDPHLYSASPGDIATLSESDAVFYVGHHLEGRLADALEKLAVNQLSVAVAERIPESKLLREDGAIDPHLWFDVALWAEVAEEVRDILVTFDPEGAQGYTARTRALTETLQKLDGEVRTDLAKIPESKRILVTAHDAFGYLGRAYDIEVIGVQGLSTESEAAVARINELVESLATREIPAVFVESTISRRNIEALVEGCRARGHTLQIGGELYSDAMGPAGEPAGTYIGMVRSNVRTLVDALR